MATSTCTCNRTHPSQCPKHKDAKTYEQMIGGGTRAGNTR